MGFGVSTSGNGTYIQATVDLGTAAERPESILVAIADAGVTSGSTIVLSVQVGTERNVDELEMGPVDAMVGTITPGVGADILVTATDGTAEGTYIINYLRG